MSRTIFAADLFCGAGGTSTGLMKAAARLGCDVRLLAINHYELNVDESLLDPFPEFGILEHRKKKLSLSFLHYSTLEKMKKFARGLTLEKCGKNLHLFPAGAANVPLKGRPRAVRSAP